MVGAGRFVLACLLGAGAAGLASPRPVHAAGCEAILGKWIWFTGGVVSINTSAEVAKVGRGRHEGQSRADAPHVARDDEDDALELLHALLGRERHRAGRGELQVSAMVR